MKREVTDWEKIFKTNKQTKEHKKKGTKDLNRHFRKDIHVSNKHIRKYSTSLVIRKMQNNSTRMAKIGLTTPNVKEDVNQLELLHIAVGV